MRHRIALVGILLVGVACGEAYCAEGGATWWPFGKKTDAELAPKTSEAPPTVTTAPPVASDSFTTQQSPVVASDQPAVTDDGQEQSWMIKSPFANVSWPRLKMPEKSEEASAPSLPSEAARNAWVETTPEPPRPSPFQAMKDGARRMGQSTREAWDKTVDAVTPGETKDRSSRVARRPKQPSVWKRMFSANTAEPTGAQTMPQFIAQDRPE